MMIRMEIEVSLERAFEVQGKGRAKLTLDALLGPCALKSRSFCANRELRTRCVVDLRDSTYTHEDSIRAVTVIDMYSQLKIVAWISSWISYVESMLIGDELCVEIAWKQRGKYIDSTRTVYKFTRKDHTFHVDFCQFIHVDFFRRSTRIFRSSKK
ncbi:unnamed protein product [Trichogramma brassicae]|uniref:Uncharacterized protein n=1 Tax=Trichogramma brassicae TaxID=86971 RepID=A0A6H5IYZ2_9HYME|nr:unnamed protein product [Trichogramma brassicae]